MHDNRSFAHAHGSKTIVLSYNKISGADQIDQSKVNAVGTFADSDGLDTFTPDVMGGVAYYDTFSSMRIGKADGKIRNRTAVGIDQNSHTQ